MQKRRIFMVSAVTLLVLLFAGGMALAGNAHDQLKASIDSLIALLKDDTLKAPEKRLERRERIFEIVKERFDFATMGKRALARNWKTLSPKEREEFVGTFTKVIENSYISRIEKYTDEEVFFKGERPKGKYYYIYTEVVSGPKKIPVNYSVHPVGDSWLVYDVNIEGVSLVRNYRTQFDEMMRKEKFAGLMSKLQDKVKRLERERDKEKGE